MRPVVSYDDITAPQAPPVPQTGPPSSFPQPPPAKKRKTNQRPANGRPQQHFQHWDDPGSNAAQMSYDDVPVGAETGEEAQEDEDEEDEESRELTHDEIWDDSALVDAWESAMAEYEAFHGQNGKWKEEPVKKSPLWYNVPPSDTKSKGKGKGKAKAGASTAPATNGTHSASYQAQAAVGVEADSAPLDFDTFVPTHDPSLAALGTDYASLPGGPGSIVSQDEAFSRALSAMYWGGYWTAVYHYHRKMDGQATAGKGVGEGEDGEDAVGEDPGADEQDEEMISTQR